MEEKNTVPAAIPPAGTEDIPTRKDRRPIIIAVAAVAATVLAVGGVCGYRVYENHRVSLARQACASAVADQSKAVKSYKALLNADATTAALKTDATSVKDAKTLDALKQAVGVETPGMVRCDASDKTGLDEAAAKAQAEQEAAAQAAAAQQAQQQAQAQRSYSYGSYSSGGWSGSAGGQSYSGGSYSGGSQGGSSSNAGSSSSSASDDIHYDWEGTVTINPSCASGGFCPIG